MNLGCNYINSQLRNMKQIQEKKSCMSRYEATFMKCEVALATARNNGAIILFFLLSDGKRPS